MYDSYDASAFNPAYPWLRRGRHEPGNAVLGGTLRHRRPEVPASNSNLPLLSGPASLYALLPPNYGQNESPYFRDVTWGGYSTAEGSYLAGQGYDMYTGIGTPIADTLIPALANETIAPPPTTWTGARSVYWTDNQNWSTGLCPTSTTDVVIDSATVTVNSSNAKANSLELSNTTLDIPSGDTLTVSGSITLDGSSTIEVDSGGTLVHATTSSRRPARADR